MSAWWENWTWTPPSPRPSTLAAPPTLTACCACRPGAFRTWAAAVRSAAAPAFSPTWSSTACTGRTSPLSTPRSPPGTCTSTALVGTPWRGRPFWDAAQQHRLVMQRCADCGAFVWHSQPWCRACYGQRLAWQELSGAAELFTYSVVHYAPLAGLRVRGALRTGHGTADGRPADDDQPGWLRLAGRAYRHAATAVLGGAD